MRLIKSLLLSTALVATLSAREQVNVNFADLQIKDFIKLIAKITNKNILINHKITGSVDFVSTSPIYDDELLNILVSVLSSKGFTLVEDGSIYKVVRATEAAKNNVAVVKSGKNTNGSLMVTQILKIKNENVDIVAAKVRYLISKTAKLMTMKESNTMLITDYPKNIETIKKVVKELNEKSKNIVQIFTIKHTEVKKLKAHLETITKSIFNPKISEEKINIIVDDNINSLIVIGAKANVSIVKGLIAKLDKESTDNKGIQIFPLKNSDSKAVLSSLNAIISKQTFKDKSLKPSLSASEEINAIIVIGDPLVVKGIKRIIDELDKEKYQVYVQARILEINEKDTESLGVKYGFGGGATKSVGSSSGLFSLATNFTGSATPLAPDTSLGTSLSATKTNFALGATLDFLETKGASKAISNPSILCINNKESSIYVGKTISVSSGKTTGTSSSTTYKREDVGLTLKVKPRVSSMEKVTLEVSVKLENVTDDGSNNATGQPVTSKQEIKTQTILRHGESIIIGGLVKTYDIKSKSKVPLLGDIPWLGKWLFSSTSIREEKDNLVVILTPYVINKSEKLSQLQKELGMLEKLQKEYELEVFQTLEEKAKKIANEKRELEEDEE